MAVSETGRDLPKAQVLFPGNLSFDLGESHGQTCHTEQAVRVMITLGLESWSDTTNWAGG